MPASKAHDQRLAAGGERPSTCQQSAISAPRNRRLVSFYPEPNAFLQLRLSRQLPEW